MPSSIPQRQIIHPEYTKSWLFNGSSGRIVSNATVDLTPYSKLVIDFWFYKASVGGNTGIIAELSVVGSVAGTFIVYLNNGTTITAYLAGVTGVRNWNSENLNIGWYHVAAVFDRTSGANISKIYLNGILSGGLIGSTETGGGNFVNDTLNIGARNASSLWLSGNIKDFRISSFTGNWADDDAKVFYQGIIPVGYTNRLHYLGEDASTTAVDSVSAQNATLTNVTYNTTIVPSIARTNAATRRFIRSDYTKSWVIVNGSTIISNNTVDFSTYSKLVVDFNYKPTNSGVGILVELGPVANVAGRFVIYQKGTDNILEAILPGVTGNRVWNSGALTSNVWRHCIAMFDRTLGANKCKIYVEKIPSGSLQSSTETGGGNFNNENLYIGSRNGSSLWFNGNLKDVRISSFTGTWSDDDAVEFYKGYVPAGYIKRLEYLGEDTGTTAVDSVSSQNATLTNISYDTTVLPPIATLRTAVPAFIQNLITYSEDFSNVIWTKSNVTVSANQIANPINGAMDADLITDDNSNSTHILYMLTPTRVIKVGEQFTVSYYIKANTNQWVSFDSLNGNVYFDLINGVLGTISANSSNQVFGRIEPVISPFDGTTWYRISGSATCTPALGNIFRLRMANVDGGLVYAGASNKSFYLWGFQVNKSLYPSPYIQTVATSVDTSVGRSII